MDQPSVDMSSSKVQAQISAKASLQARHENGKAPSSSSSSSSSRDPSLPPGQRRAKNWIVLDLGVKPDAAIYNLASWELQVVTRGSASSAASLLSLDDLRALGTQEYSVDWHCVTGWSTCQIKFLGVPLARVVEACAPPSSWQCLMQTGADGYTVNVHREDVMYPGAFLALSFADGSPIPLEHGGQRIVLPHLFGWKSCKWLHSVQFLDEQAMGFWERLGCHMRGRVELGERWAPRSKSIWDFLTGILGLYFKVFPQSAVFSIMQYSAKVLGWFTLAGASVGLRSRTAPNDAATGMHNKLE